MVEVKASTKMGSFPKNEIDRHGLQTFIIYQSTSLGVLYISFSVHFGPPSVIWKPRSKVPDMSTFYVDDFGNLIPIANTHSVFFEN